MRSDGDGSGVALRLVAFASESDTRWKPALHTPALASDGIFRDDGAAMQMLEMQGSATTGYVASIRVVV